MGVIDETIFTAPD
ncbi:hypothetical protein PDE_00512 [Penicillium oxalicum 114-2]|uniref:Uncharacterized protein n=1 Tax=Penicillium oxalicum (strain 114-2 / CGMCC 5302) TaxID=933388 RepID=S8AIJ7_PENO1|nr:hypothetical protein PDE_00512 [Penicillium oxalicum 114-2]